MSKILLNSGKYNIGSHVGFSGNIKNSIEYGIDMSMYSIQIFLGNPQSINRAKLTDDDIEKSARLISRFPMNIYIHTPYLFNLCGSIKSLAWNGDSIQDNLTNKVVNSISHELDTLYEIYQKSDKNNCKFGVVCHPGSYHDKKLGLKKIAETINKIVFPECEAISLLLENSSGGGTKLCTTFEEINEIIQQVDENKRKYIKVCIDTAHIYGYGSYDIRKIEEIDRMFEEFDRIIGKEKLGLIHLNDSSETFEKRSNAFFGSKKDVHALIGRGYIWKDKENLRHFLNRVKYYIKDEIIPIVLETNPSDVIIMSYFD